MSIRSRLLLLIALTSICLPASAGVIYSNLGPGDSFAADGCTLGLGGGVCGYQFQAATSANVTSIELVAFLVDGDTGLDVWLKSDNGGLPGTTLEHFQLAAGSLLADGKLFSLPSLLNPPLTSGSSYWLLATTTNPDAWATWNYTDPAVLGTSYFFDGTDETTLSGETMGAFRVNGTSSDIPEPGTLSMLLAGAALIAAKLARR